MSSGADTPPGRVTTLELFFDLVFVFTVTQLTARLAHHPTWGGVGQVALALGLIWWMYDGYAWLTNAVALDGPARRAGLLTAMAAFLVLALAIPGAYGDDGLAFGLAYLAIVVVHIALFTRAAGGGATAILRVGPVNLTAAGLVIAGGAVGGTAQYVLWILAFVVEWGSPYALRVEGGFDVEPGHFVERHGLVILIAIGESVVAVGIGAAQLALDGPLVGIIVLGLSLSAAFWWAYFGGEDGGAEHALRAAGDRGARLALDAFGVAHLPMLLGVVAAAFGLERALGHPYEGGPTAPAVGLALGTAAFLLGDVRFRALTGRRGSGWRLGAAVLAPATIPLGTAVAPAAQLAVLVLGLGGALAAEGLGILSGRGAGGRAGGDRGAAAGPARP